MAIDRADDRWRCASEGDDERYDRFRYGTGPIDGNTDRAEKSPIADIDFEPIDGASP